MAKNQRVFWAKTVVILGAVPLLIWAHEYGPDAGYCGVPKELGTCAQAGCHTGTANTGSGKVSVTFPNGQTYSPGVKQHLVVTISDSSQIAWGFQLTPRLASNSAGMAGTLASTDANTTIMCADTALFNEKEAPYVASGTQTCAANLPLQYVEHSLAGYNAMKGHAGSGSFEFDWTPPATDSGDITIYVAGNAANGDLTVNGDHIYTASFTLKSSGNTGGTPPSISNNGVVSAGAFGAFSSIAPGTWIEIYGANLSSSSRQWAGSDFTGTAAPTSLDGVKVTIGGQPAYVDFISPGQVNAQVPSNVTSGQKQMTVTNGTLTSTSYNIVVNDVQPGLLAPPNFNIGSKQYVVAQHSDNSFVLPPGAISGLTTRQAKPGETVVIYGIGFGPAKDTSNAVIPAGQIVTAANQLTGTLQMQVNGVTASLGYFGLAPNFVGLYQFNVVVPAVADGDWPLTFTLKAAKGTQTLFLSVHQ